MKKEVIEQTFDIWNEQKKAVDIFVAERPEFKVREIWNAKVGYNIGFEQRGEGKEFIRPVLVFRKFNNEISWIIPLSKTNKDGEFYFKFVFIDGVKSNALLSQIKLMDAKRFVNKIGVIKNEEFLRLKEKFMTLMP